MDYDSFIGQVHHRAHLSSKGQAVAAVRATLTTLAQRLTPEETKDLAAQLPQEIAVYLRGGDQLGPERLAVHEFLQRVAGREHVDMATANFHARVVLSMIKESVSKGELDDVLAQLPDEYHPLFGVVTRNHS